MIVVDSSAVVAILLAEPDHSVFIETLAKTDAAILGAPNMLEIVIVATAKLGDTGRARTELLIAELLIEVVALEPDHLAAAFDAHTNFGRGRNHPARLNFGDCMAYALAKSLDAPLLYKGGDFALTDVRSAV